MANVVQNRMTVLGPQNDVELLKLQIAEEAKASGGYHDLPCILYQWKDLQEAGSAITFETYHRPPYEALREVSKKYPRLVFCVSFLEEDYWYGRLVYWRGSCLSCEEYTAVQRKDHQKARNLLKNHKTLERRGRRYFLHLEALDPRWLLEDRA